MGKTYPSLTQRGFVMPTRLKASAAYESGSSSGSRTRNWQGSGVGPNFAAAQNLPLMRGRARDAVRNDPWAKTSVARFVSNVIGTGMRQQLMAAAASVGFPYEVLTGDLREVNDRVLRVILNEFRRGIEQLQWNVFIHQYCRRVWAAWIDALALSGAMPMPDFYRTRREYLRVRWVPQGWPSMQPVQDMQAKRMAVRAGFTSRSAVVLEQGDDPETIDEENAVDNARADAQQLRYDSDARVLDVAGDPTDPTNSTKDVIP